MSGIESLDLAKGAAVHLPLPDRAGAGDAVQIQDMVGVALHVTVRKNPDASGTLTVTVQHSDDGSSWQDLQPFTFEASDPDGQWESPSSAPKAHLRAVWSGPGVMAA